MIIDGKKEAQLFRDEIKKEIDLSLRLSKRGFKSDIPWVPVEITVS